MDIVKTTKDLAKNVEEKVEHGIEVAKETFANVASHLPFANLARKGSDGFVIEVDLPGVKKEDIELQIEDNILSIKAVRKMKNEVHRDDYYLCESNFGLISRSFILPDGIDTQKIDARYEDGRLYISLEKEEERKAKSISVK
jgi:HSP20 family protein